MNVYEDEWYWCEDLTEFEAMFPEADRTPEEFPVSVQVIETNMGLLFSVLPTEMGTYLWNAPQEVQFIADFELDEEDDKKKETYH